MTCGEGGVTYTLSLLTSSFVICVSGAAVYRWVICPAVLFNGMTRMTIGLSPQCEGGRVLCAVN